MFYDKELVAGKLRRWEKYLIEYRLPDWDSIPDFGLYMEQVLILLKDYLDYLPPELKDEEFITAATINNYVRKKIMPEPVKKKYYRVHIAYLIMIISLKQSLSLSMLSTIIPMGITEQEVKGIYEAYVDRHKIVAGHFIEEIRCLAGNILDHDVEGEMVAADTNEVIISSAVIGGFARLLAEKLLLLEGKKPGEAGDIELG